jgi:hypothetical protein
VRNPLHDPRERISPAGNVIVWTLANPLQHEPQERFPQEPSSSTPAADSEAPSPDSDQADLDARLSGMSVLLRVALRLMKSYNTSQSPSRRDRDR